MSAPTLTVPPRRWANEPKPVAPAPVILTSSRDGAGVPHVVGAARLARAAEAAGWKVLQQYALADVPATSRGVAHRLASVAVVLARPGVRGYAVWHSRDGGAWRFASAAFSPGRTYGLRVFTAAITS